MAEPERFIYVNGVIRPAGEAVVSPEMNGIYHGTGTFETFLSNSGKIFRYDEHIHRLNGGLDYLGFSPVHRPDPESLRSAISDLLHANGFQNKRVKVRVQFSDSDTGGYDFGPHSAPLQLITAEEIASSGSGSVTLKSTDICVVPMACRPSNLKLSNMLHYRDAMRQARNHGAGDALMCTTAGFVAESAIANIFWFYDGKVFTPSADCDILPGIMRNALIELIEGFHSGGFECIRGRFQPDDLYKAECIWLTNSVLGMMPVSAIDGRPFHTDHPVFRSLREHLQTLIAETSR